MATGTGEKKCRYNKALYRPGDGIDGLIFVNRLLGVPVPVDVSLVQMLGYGLEMQRGSGVVFWVLRSECWSYIRGSIRGMRL